MFTIPVGTPVELKLWIDGVRVDTHAVVATCDSQVGNGLRFVIIMSKDRARIQAFVYNLFDRNYNYDGGKKSSGQLVQFVASVIWVFLILRRFRGGWLDRSGASSLAAV